MSPKNFIVICVQALFVQMALSQCIGQAVPASAIPTIGLAGLAPPACKAGGLGLIGYGTGSGLASCGASSGLAGYGTGSAFTGYGAGSTLAGYGAGSTPQSIEYSATNGGAFPVSSASAIAPTGLSVESQNVFEGALSVIGELPFLGTVAVEGAYPSAGAGVVNHSCGNGVTAITSESNAYATGSANGVGLAAYAPAAAVISSAAGCGAAIAPVLIESSNGGRYGGCGCGIY